VMVSWLSTFVTPGADAAAFLAAAASLQELTCPCSVTWPSSVVSQIRRASIWAWRCRASVIFALTSFVVDGGLHDHAVGDTHHTGGRRAFHQGAGRHYLIAHA
jgi:hypothetical protein